MAFSPATIKHIDKAEAAIEIYLSKHDAKAHYRKAVSFLRNICISKPAIRRGYYAREENWHPNADRNSRQIVHTRAEVSVRDAIDYLTPLLGAQVCPFTRWTAPVREQLEEVAEMFPPFTWNEQHEGVQCRTPPCHIGLSPLGRYNMMVSFSEAHNKPVARDGDWAAWPKWWTVWAHGSGSALLLHGGEQRHPHAYARRPWDRVICNGQGTLELLSKACAQDGRLIDIFGILHSWCNASGHEMTIPWCHKIFKNPYYAGGCQDCWAIGVKWECKKCKGPMSLCQGCRIAPNGASRVICKKCRPKVCVSCMDDTTNHKANFCDTCGQKVCPKCRDHKSTCGKCRKMGRDGDKIREGIKQVSEVLTIRPVEALLVQGPGGRGGDVPGGVGGCQRPGPPAGGGCALPPAGQ